MRWKKTESGPRTGTVFWGGGGCIFLSQRISAFTAEVSKKPAVTTNKQTASFKYLSILRERQSRIPADVFYSPVCPTGFVNMMS